MIQRFKGIKIRKDNTSRSGVRYWLFDKVITIILMGLFMVMTGCSTSIKRTDTPVITVSILPQKYFVDRITNNTFEVNVMVPPGASPATYEPTARQMAMLSDSKLYIRIGYIEFEKAWIGKIKNSNKNLKIYDSSKGIEFIGGPAVDHKDHSHGMDDPHIWMSPKMVKTICKNTLKAIISEYPGKKDEFNANYKQLIADIDKLDTETSDKLTACKGKKFLIFHPALTYFAREYSLEQIPIQLEGKDPSPAYFREIINYARDNYINIIFIQQQFDTENAKVIARETGCNIVQINPLDYDWPKQIEHITRSLLKYNKKN